MYSRPQLIWKYFVHQFSSFGRAGHGVHSPFVFDFITNVIRDKREHHAGFESIEQRRKKWIRSAEKITVLDLGAGSVHTKGELRKLSDIVRYAAKPARLGRFFYRLIRHCKIDAVLELGTSLGITARYFAIAAPSLGVVTIEGAPAVAAAAARSLEEDGLDNVKVRVGDFQEHLERELAAMKGTKLVYVDGNHRYEPTVGYFETILRYAGNDDVVVFDDIHWSRDMERAWQEIRKSEAVRCSMDLFFIGVVFFRKEFKEKTHFSIRF